MRMTRMKTGLLDLLSRLLFGKWANPLKRVIESVQVSRPELLSRAVKIRGAEMVEYAHPDGFPSFFRRMQAFPERHVFELKEAIVLKQTGVVLTPDEMILQESAGTLRRLFRWDDLRDSLAGGFESLRLDRPCCFLPCKPFFHFLCEELPGLLYAWEQQPDLLVLTIPEKEQPPYYADALRLLFREGLPQRVQAIERNVRLQRYIFTQRDNFTGHLHRADFELLNRHLCPAVGGDKRRRIYLSRRTSPLRKLQNEDDIESCVRQQGFEVLALEEYPLGEQIGIMAQCEALVSPHGAGLAHMLWNPALRKSVLEIFPSWVTNDVYASMARTLGYHYHYLLCRREGEEERADLELLEQKLQALGLP
jgi:capsular polysaccharide biosynthesis protein